MKLEVLIDVVSLLSEINNKYNRNKNLCGRDGRTICGPQCVPKSTSVTLAVDKKTLPMATITGRTDRQTDGQRDSKTDRQTDIQNATHNAAPSRKEGRIITNALIWLWNSFLFIVHLVSYTTCNCVLC